MNYNCNYYNTDKMTSQRQIYVLEEEENIDLLTKMLKKFFIKSPDMCTYRESCINVLVSII